MKRHCTKQRKKENKKNRLKILNYSASTHSLLLFSSTIADYKQKVHLHQHHRILNVPFISSSSALVVDQRNPDFCSICFQKQNVVLPHARVIYLSFISCSDNKHALYGVPVWLARRRLGSPPQELCLSSTMHPE